MPTLQMFELIIDTPDVEEKAKTIIRNAEIPFSDDDFAVNVLYIDATRCQDTEDLLNKNGIEFQWGIDPDSPDDAQVLQTKMVEIK
jgi:hypothetical protein